MDIKNKVAIVTGGASGLGRATAELFAERGAKVAVFDLQDELGGAFAADDPDSRAYYNTNVVSEETVQANVNAVLERFGAVHICVNCAGIGSAAKTVGKDGPHPLQMFQKVIDINLVGSFNVLRLCAEKMQGNEPEGDAGERGVIISTASVAAQDGQMGQAAYSASKGGLVGMTLPIARDLAKLGIRNNTILPGLFNTPLFQGMPQEVIDALVAMIQFPKRLGDPSEYALMAAQIVENAYLNGECIRLDAGIRMQPR
ncbi:MAG: 3-hydroxyacyl-CoA dehydrogenase [Pseudomonadota bacterium]